MGEVFICGADGTDTEFALKSFQPRLFFDASSREAFLREITVWLLLTGTPFVMPAFGVEEYSGRFLIRMSAIAQDNRGIGTIRDLITRKCSSPTEAFQVVLQFASGMQFLGQTIPGVSHGDLTPENLLYNGGPVLISDFGLAAVGRGDKGFRATPHYESPEYTSSGPSPAGDVFSFGTIVNELIKSCVPGGFLSGLWRRPASNLLLQALGQIAQSCLVQDASKRPSFDDIVHQLFAMLKTYPDNLRDVFFTTAALHSVFRDLQIEMAPDIARNLLKIGNPETALQVIEKIPEIHHGSSVAILRGTSLSLLDRDDEALSCFETALQDDLSETERLNCLSEYALSLKRLGRLDEAKRIYLGLLSQASEEQHAQVAINLAGVYQEGGEYEKSIDLLMHFIRQHQDQPLAYAALGHACEKLDRHEAAAIYYQRVLSLAPDRADIQVELARIYLEHLGRWEDAAETLYAAFQQGFMSREWLKLSIVTATLLARKRDFDELMKGAERDLPPDVFKSIEKEAVELVVALARKAVTRDEGGKLAETNKPSFSGTDRTADVVEPQSDALEPSSRALTESTPSTLAASPFEPAGFPFFNVRFYLPEKTFSCDFYDNLDDPDYVAHFFESWHRFRRDPSVSNDAEPRPKPLYFHICPSCGVRILTNRDLNARIRCRQCDYQSACGSFEDENTTNVLSRVRIALGKEITSQRGLTEYVVFQLSVWNAEAIEEMKRLCREAGFVQVEGGITTPVGYLAIAQGRKGGLAFDTSQEIVVVSKLSHSDEQSHSGDTPPESDRLIRSLRSVAPVWSCSMQIDLADQNPGSLFMAGKTAEFELQCRNDVESSPEDVGKLLLLAQALLANNKLEEAKSVALRATLLAPTDPNAWSSLASIDHRLGDHGAAIEHANKALSIDPLKREALVTLLFVHKERGDEKAASEVWARISALGGPLLFG